MDKLVFALEIKSIDEEDPNFFIFEGYGSTFGNIDEGYDRVVAGAFKNTIDKWNRSSKRMPVLWQHDSTMPIGIFVSMQEDQKGLFVKGKLPKDDSFVKGRVVPQMKIGSICDMSIGYYAKRYSYDEGGMVRNLEEIDLVECSLVTMPMNAMANVTGFKSVNGVREMPLAPLNHAWDAKAAEARIRAFTKSETTPSESLKECYLYSNLDALEDFESYKFLITDVVDGKLAVVMAALQAAAISVQTDSKTPSESTEGLKATIDRYCRKFQKPSPFAQKSCVRIESIELLSERELERLLKRGVFFTSAQAKMLVSSIMSSRREGKKASARDAGIKELQQILSQFKSL